MHTNNAHENVRWIIQTARPQFVIQIPQSSGLIMRRAAMMDERAPRESWIRPF